nr:MAG TPA: hypothetical protein [Caudoviricetes sp.]DAG32340.1 MAG TPA: hypothetical protein [Caudoviricetes sp.]
MENKNWTIKEIEAITQQQAAAMAESVQDIKGHQVYFVDFGGYFGFSALVYADGQPIIYANDYELHHQGRARADLRALYVSTLSEKLFTVDELRGPVSDYDELRAKEYYIRNYYGMRRPHVSMWFAGPEAQREALRRKVEKMVFSPVFCAYYDPKDADFVKQGAALLEGLSHANEANRENADFWESAFLYEMFNHEYGINWQADFDVCGCFGNVSGVRDYTDREKLFDACGFNDIQRQAYAAARRKYFKSESANL